MKLSKIFGRQRFFLHLNVQVAVNVHTKLCVTQDCAKTPTAGSAARTASTKAAPAPKMLAISPAGPPRHANASRKTKTPLAKNSNSPFGGISLMLLMNLLMLLLLSSCCGVCRSNEFPLTTPPAAVVENATSSPTLTDPLGPAHAASGQAKAVGNLLTAVTVMIPEISTQAVENITNSCLRACKREESSYANGWGHNCSGAAQGDRQRQSTGVNGRCYRTSCNKGCEQWWHAVKAYETCQEACTWQHSYPYDLPCLLACEASRRTYWHLQLQAVEPIVQTIPPQLYADPNTAMSTLELHWSVKLPELYLASNQVRIQYQQVQQDRPAAWLYLNKYECSENFDCEIYHDGLMPFTNYSFRFELPFGTSANELLHSLPTKVFKTPAAGPPTSAPVITNILSMDHSHVAIYWQPGVYTNGPLKSYRLELKNMATRQSTEKRLLSYVEKYIFDSLSPSTKYSFSISMVNDVDIGPNAIAELTTPALPNSAHTTDDLTLLIIAGENSIRTKTLEPMAETKLVHKSEQLITDFGLYQAGQKLFVVNALGEINGVLLDQPMKFIPLVLDPIQINFKPVKISVDWLNQQLYLAGEISNISWSIVTTDLLGNFIAVQSNNITETIQQLEVDPINGWLFWLTTSGRMERMDLATRHVRVIYDKSGELGYFTNIYGSFLLTAYNKSEHALYELCNDGSYVKGLQENATQVLGGEWQSYAKHGKYVVATNGTHLLQQHSETKEHELMVIPEIEWCWKLVVGQQSGPVPRSGPHALQAVLTANKASVSWSAPQRAVEFQSAGAWNGWEYQLEVMDVVSNNAFSIRNIRTPLFMVGNLQANNLYKWRVCAMTGRGDCVWGDEELLTRTWPLGEHKLIWAGSTGFYETNEMGGAGRRIGGDQLGDVRDFEQLNGTLYYIKREENSTRQSLTCAFMMNPEVVCGFKAENAVSLSYDWRGGKLYWADGLVGCIMRANLDGSQREVLPLFGAELIEVDAYAGYIYYATAERLLRSTLSGFNELLTVEYFNQYGDEELIRDFAMGEIRGFALNLMQQQIYWIYRHPEGKMYLHMSLLDKPGDILEKVTIAGDILRGSLKYLNEIQCLMWLDLESNELVLLRTQDFQQQVKFAGNATGGINSVQVGVDYTRFMDLSIIPTAVEADSIVIDNGYWDDFNIRWNASLTAENYTVYYRVSFWLSKDSNHSLYSDVLEVNQPFLRINDFRRPHLYLNISITPCTYWAQGKTVNVRLQTPGVDRSQPRHLRAFVEHTTQPLQEEENISAVVRWAHPENYSTAAPKAYRINCWLDKQLLGIYNHSGVEPLELRLRNLTQGANYNIQVQAFQAARAASGAEETATLSLTVNTDAQALPKVIYANSLHIGVLDLDSQTQKVLGYTSSEIEHLALMQGETRLLWVNENVELISYIPGFAQTKLARMRAEVMALTVDWIQRIVYWAERSTDEQTVAIYKLDLCHYEGYVSMGTKIASTHNRRLIKELIVLPFSQSLLWLEYNAEEPENATLKGLHLKDSSTLHFKHATYSHMFEGCFNRDMETVNLLDSQGKLCTYDLQRQICTQLKLTLPANSTHNISDLARDNGYIYILTPEKIEAFNRRKKSLDYNVQHQQAKCIKAYNSQPYPSRKCLLPATMLTKQQMSTHVRKIDEQYVTLELPKLNEDQHCPLPVPGTKYALQVFQIDKNSTELFVQNVTSFERLVNITQLQQFTNYSIKIAASSYYQKKLHLPPPLLSSINIFTAAGTPSEPRNFTAYALSATEIEVSWAPPLELNCDRVWYQLHWQMVNSSLGTHKTLNATSFTLMDLMPAQPYLIWLKVFSMENKFNSTAPLHITTFDEPRDLLLEQKTAYNLTLSWLPPANLKSITLVYYITGEEEFANHLVLDISAASKFQLLDLTPKTRYELYFALSYNSSSPVPHISQWPTPLNARFSFETLGDCPSRPGKPQIEYIAGEIFKISWSPAVPNGAPIVEYSMEALQPHLPKRLRRQVNESFAPLTQPLWAEEPTPIEDQWLVYCNTTELSCIVKEVYSQRLVLFRVRARNQAYGWGPYSELSDRIMEPMVTPERRNSLIIAIVSPAAIVSFCVLVLVAVKVVKQRRLRKEKLLAKSRPSVWSNLSSVQQQLLLQQRMRAASIASHSTLYYGGPLSDADIALLPQVSWKQLAITKFLGSGAFGEVYEGLIQFPDEPEPQKVAIKSLRKGYSEFSELLKEAQLMSNFKHENIVGLIGISYDTETISIIMEFMEGGDLLTYLRDSRPNSSKPMNSLKLIELLTMCIDVATGCSYLEDMHFVHRDLACRNCLVSSRDASKRVVKIGDFGLARDIYKSDYYRKEGEGLLPVRWMSPESLVDGVFTTQSDVWSFAVLCWEILTLGQQPYAGRNNIEVLNFVKDGGRLEHPDNCPDKLFDFLSECWQVDPDERPSFRRCLNMLLAIKTEVRRFSSGYNIDNADYALYANSQSLVLSSFLGKPLDRVDEEPEDYRSSIENPSKYEDVVLKRQSGEVTTKPPRPDSTFMTIKRSSMSSKASSASPESQPVTPELKVHFESTHKADMELGSVTDLAVLLAGMQSKQNGEGLDVYENEGFSRL